MSDIVVSFNIYDALHYTSIRSEMIIIRSATNDDAESLAILNHEVQELHARARPRFFKRDIDEAEVIAFFEEACAQPENHIYIAETGEQPVGYIYCELVNRHTDPFTNALRYITIHHIVVKQSFRGQGIGSQLIQAAIDLARDEDILDVILEVWSFNEKARRFFVSQGFKMFNQRMGISLSEEQSF
jgi:ribosomal protein S18 acetylase RimI-like enzyme